MKNTTYLALLTAVSMTAPSHAAEPPQSSGVERPESNGTTTDEVEALPTRVNSLPIEEGSDTPSPVKDAISMIKNTQAELDRIKEALKRIQRMNPDLTSEQLNDVKARLMHRARELVTNARSVSDRIDELRPRLAERGEIFEALDRRKETRQSAIKAATGRERD